MNTFKTVAGKKPNRYREQQKQYRAQNKPQLRAKYKQAYRKKEDKRRQMPDFVADAKPDLPMVPRDVKRQEKALKRKRKTEAASLKQSSKSKRQKISKKSR